MAVRNPMTSPAGSPEDVTGHEQREFWVNCLGKKPNYKKGLQQNETWTIGDIDFDPDNGSIFIRNPYLANAIQEQLKANQKAWKAWKDAGGKPGDPDEPVLFRLTRDEGWSGGKVNMVC